MTQPMGNSGVQIDSLTRQPINLEDGVDMKKASARTERLIEMHMEGQSLRLELGENQGAVLRILEAEMIARAGQVLSQDPEYQALYRFAQRLGVKMNILPAHVRRELKKIMGENVYRLNEEKAAPEGIPADE